MKSMSKALMDLIKQKRLLPKISATERVALMAGTNWTEPQFFGGRLDFAELLKQPYGKLTAEEQAFVDGPCDELCRMVDPWELAQTRRIPEPVMDFIKSQGFMGLMIPKKYGGKGFSRLAISTVMAKLMPHCSLTATVVIIANSLTAAELIIHYGTPYQKRHYLPALANGDWIPTFALTEKKYGSDAAGIEAEGVVFRDSDGQVKIRFDFDKRYQTLAPIANLITLAGSLHDPDKLLGDVENIDITCVLIEGGTPGLEIGKHHQPIGPAFENGPITGRNVIVSVDNIIGGPDCAGLGWKMLMEQLAGGRAGSLPAGAIGGMWKALIATGAYSMIRWQFGMFIGRMEGIEDKLARIAALTYMFEAARISVCSAIDQGIKPPVTSGMLKAYSTDQAGKMFAEGMRVLAGAGVMEGPNNVLAPLYQSAPVGETVEGANIMTFSFLINGQGAVRCHPFVLRALHALESGDEKAFGAALSGWLRHSIGGFFRGALCGLTHGLLHKLEPGMPDVAPETRTYYRRLAWAASHFGVLVDLAVLLVGARLKGAGRLNTRYADAFAWMMLGCFALRRFEAEGRRVEDLPLVEWALEHALSQVQIAFEGIYANFKVPVVGFFMRKVGLWWLRINPLSLGPCDRVSHQAAKTIQTLNDQFRRLYACAFIPAEDQPGLGRLLKAFRLSSEARGLIDRIEKWQKARARAARQNDQLPDAKPATRRFAAEMAKEACEAGVISGDELVRLDQMCAACLEACEVDVFEPQQYYRDRPQADRGHARFEAQQVAAGSIHVR
jgi:acyl-CoA dehydrogenase